MVRVKDCQEVVGICRTWVEVRASPEEWSLLGTVQGVALGGRGWLWWECGIESSRALSPSQGLPDGAVPGGGRWGGDTGLETVTARS